MAAKKKVIAGGSSILDSLIADTNTRLAKSGSLGKVYRAKDLSYAKVERFHSGSVGLDIIMGGGIPRGRVIEYYGEESAGKTTATALAIAARQQAQPKANFFIAAAEKFEPQWWRTMGCFIVYSEEEMWEESVSAEEDGRESLVPQMEEYNERASEYGEFVVLSIPDGAKLLEETFRYVRSGQFDVGVVDSLGAIRPTVAIDVDSKDYREVGDDEFGGNAKMFGRFAGKIDSALNTRLATGEENMTSLILINQVRASIGGWHPSGTPPPKPTGGFAIRHLKHVSVEFRKGASLKTAGDHEEIYGRMTRAKCEKNKTARPLRDCEFPFYFMEHEQFQYGIDKAYEFAEWSVYYNLVEQKGAFYYVNGEQVAQGKPKLIEFFREQPQLMDEMLPLILKAAEK